MVAMTKNLGLRLPIALACILSPFAASAESEAEIAVDRVLQEETAAPTLMPTPSPNSTEAPSASTTTAPSQAPLEPWGGCVDPTDKNAMVARGQRTTICLTVGPGGNWNRKVPGADPPGGVEYMRYSFQPTADEYTSYKIPNSYLNLVQLEAKEYLLPDIAVFASSGTALSFLRHWYEKDENTTEYGKIFPHLTAIVDVKDGVVSGITWDDACVFCNQNLCIENTYDFNGLTGVERGLNEPTRGCYLQKFQCDEIHKQGGNECDLTLFVVWTGNDAKGNVMSSSNSRFSAFQPQQIQDRWRDQLPSLPSVPSLSDIGDSVSGTLDGLNPFGGDDEEEGENGENGGN